MPSIEHIMNHADKQCAEQGTRLTNKRKQVLLALLTANKAVSAYELIDLCKAQCGETLPAMSIYRILDFLVDEHLVHKLDLANKYIACEHIICDHSHHTAQFLICRQCNKVKEIRLQSATIEALQQSASHAGFTLDSPQLELNCLCEECINDDSH